MGLDGTGAVRGRGAMKAKSFANRVGVISLALALVAGICESGRGFLLLDWYFGKTAPTGGDPDEATKARDALGDPIACGGGVQLIWVGPDGERDLPDSGCQPTDDDEVVLTNGNWPLDT